MNRNRWSIPLVLFFLVQLMLPSGIFCDPNFPLTQIKVDSSSGDNFFKQIYESVCVGLSIYKLDAIEGYSKEKLIAASHYQESRLISRDIKFDMESIDTGKKGWTRYYPFSVGEKKFIMRIFLTEEIRYQPKAEVLYEGSISSPAVTFQILPSLNDILSDCKIKPLRTYSTSQVDRSS